MIDVGVVGCGWIAKAHMDVYSTLTGTVRVVALCDSDPGRAKSLAGQFNVPSTFTNHREMLENKRLDLVDICTPTSTHLPVTVDAAKKGCHVLSEKPMARTSEECRSMIQAAAQNKVSLCICHDKLFSQSYLKAKETLKARNLSIGTNAIYLRICDPRTWVKDKNEGGMLWEHGYHAAYIQRDLLGPIERVFAMPKSSSEGNYYVLLQSKAGPVGSIDLSEWNNHVEFVSAKIDTKTGEQLDIDWMSEYFEISKSTTILHFGLDWSANLFHDIRRVSNMRLGYAKKYLALGRKRFLRRRHLSLMTKYLESLKAHSPPPITGEDGLETVKILEAIRASAEQGKPTEL